MGLVVVAHEIPSIWTVSPILPHLTNVYSFFISQVQAFLTHESRFSFFVMYALTELCTLLQNAFIIMAIIYPHVCD